LIFTLIVLLILTIGAVALVRSMNTSLYSAGNLAFRRDLVNQGEQAVSLVLNEFKTGALSTSASTQANVLISNYSATELPTNTQGVPSVLFASNASFATVGTAPDLTGATPDVTIRYVVDRLCNAAGAPSGTTCVQTSAVPKGGTGKSTPTIALPAATIYRLSARVSGPRNTQVFVQTTLTRPD
jgi:hypothetical protein